LSEARAKPGIVVNCMVPTLAQPSLRITARNWCGSASISLTAFSCGRVTVLACGAKDVIRT